MQLEGLAFAAGIGLMGGLLWWAIGGRSKENDLEAHEKAIRRYFAEREEELVECKWNPSMQNAIANDDVTDFDVVYRDKDGRTHRATAKSMVGSVSLANDEVDEA